MNAKLAKLIKDFGLELSKPKLPKLNLPCPFCNFTVNLFFDFGQHSFHCSSCGDLSAVDVLEAVLANDNVVSTVKANFAWIITRLDLESEKE